MIDREYLNNFIVQHAHMSPTKAAKLYKEMTGQSIDRVGYLRIARKLGLYLPKRQSFIEEFINERNKK